MNSPDISTPPDTDAVKDSLNLRDPLGTIDVGIINGRVTFTFDRLGVYRTTMDLDTSEAIEAHLAKLNRKLLTMKMRDEKP